MVCLPSSACMGHIKAITMSNGVEQFVGILPLLLVFKDYNM